jgi:hypothetical protein
MEEKIEALITDESFLQVYYAGLFEGVRILTYRGTLVDLT